MITDVEKTRLKKLFSDTISLLCRSGLPGSCAHRVDALIGVTLDSQEVVLVNFSENFWHENECPREAEARTEITLEKDLITHCNQENGNSSSMCSYSVKDEHGVGASQDLYNASALGWNGGYVADITATNLHSNSHNPVEYLEQQNTESPNQDDSEIDSLLPEPEKISTLVSDGDCLLIKTELPDGDSRVDSMTAESKNFSAPSAEGISLSSLPAVYKSSYRGLSLRIKHAHSMQKYVRWNPYGSKLYRPQQRHNTMQHSASNQSQVSQFKNKTSSVFQLDGGANGLLPCAPPGDGDSLGIMSDRRDVLQCYVCGAWLRGKQTLNEHIRGRHLSIYNYHCKYCGLSFKWRSAHRNHQLNCSVSQSQ